MGMPPPFDALHFGTAGIPHSGGGGASDFHSGIRELQRLGLRAAEFEFVHRVDLSEERAKAIGSTAAECGVHLSAHAPYYVNLASMEPAKIHASIGRIVKAARILHAAGGHSVVFHAGFYQERPPEDVYSLVAQGISEIEGTLRKSGVELWIRPELTGKPTQFGDADELARLSREFEMVLPCIDFSHLHARTGGRFNTVPEWDAMVRRLLEDTPQEKGLLGRMHIHLSGIDYSPKGEKKHLPLDESDLNYEQLLYVLKKHGVRGTVICEGPEAVMIGDAQTLKSAYEKA